MIRYSPNVEVVNFRLLVLLIPMGLSHAMLSRWEVDGCKIACKELPNSATSRLGGKPSLEGEIVFRNDGLWISPPVELDEVQIGRAHV